LLPRDSSFNVDHPIVLSLSPPLPPEISPIVATSLLARRLLPTSTSTQGPLFAARRRMVPPPLSPTSLGQSAPTLSPLQLRTSTAQLYADPNPPSRDELKKKEYHSGPWREARASLDYSYHEVPSKERQLYVSLSSLSSPSLLPSHTHTFSKSSSKHSPLSPISPLVPSLQDQIVAQVLAEDHEEECKLCDSVQTRPSGSSSPGGSRNAPVALFTSGGMGAGKGHVLRTFLRNGKICLPKDFVW